MAKLQNVILLILDGWGLGNGSMSDVIAQTKTPFMDSLYRTYPNSKLLACGESVGLPNGQMGNSEVGHLNIGAGRIVYQDLMKINKAIKDNSFEKNPHLQKPISYLKKYDKQLHIIGLVSDGGVHSMNTHLYKLCDIANKHKLNNVYIHALTDGRDTDPKSGYSFIKELLEKIKHTSIKLASICGRYYGMDRDKNYDRIKKFYDLLLYGKGTSYTNPLDAIKNSYQKGITDEFLKPIVLIKNEESLTTIQENDVVLCFNFRTDRLRQLTRVFTQEEFPNFKMKTIPLKWITMTNYDDSFKNIDVLFDKKNISNTLGEFLSTNNLIQIRTAETEKYAHVTYFFSGGREEPFKGEKRILISSPKVATYDLQPEMSALEITSAITKEIEKQKANFICLNYANGDMVGHTGVYKAISQAIATVDKCVEKVITSAKKNNYNILLIADHGNADYALNPDGSPNTAHSLNPVPCIYVGENRNLSLNDGVLADVAPTILKIMGMEKPNEMTGKPLF